MPFFRDYPELIEPFRAGERAALEQLYRYYVRDVLQIARSGFVTGEGVRVPGLAQVVDQLDLLQETFSRAFSVGGRNGFDVARAYRPYLAQIAKNLRIDQLRLQRKLCLSAGPGDLDTLAEAVDPAFIAASAASSQEEREWQRLQAATREFMGTLDEPMVRFVRLRFEDGLSQADVAQALATTRRQIRTWEEQVQLDLKRFLKGRGLI